jgi:hypothetical protein
MAESATILLPDISGYTEFLTKTELVHSSHIINELLEAILAANSGEFVLSEVEGDALLLYHKGKPFEADALVRQCLSMFESFHTQLKIIERDSICHCGACKTAPDPEVHRPSRRGPGNQGQAVHEVLGARHGGRPPLDEEPDCVRRVRSRHDQLFRFLEPPASPGRSRVAAIER